VAKALTSTADVRQVFVALANINEPIGGFNIGAKLK